MNASRAVSDVVSGHDYVSASAMSPAVNVELLPIAKALADPRLQTEWDALVADASEPNPFVERWYIEAALHVLAPADIRLAVVRDGRLLGVMPLIWQNGYGGLPIVHVQN